MGATCSLVLATAFANAVVVLLDGLPARGRSGLDFSGDHRQSLSLVREVEAVSPPTLEHSRNSASGPTTRGRAGESSTLR